MSDAYDEGLDAALVGITDADNPYPMGSTAAMDWQDGLEEGEAAFDG